MKRMGRGRGEEDRSEEKRRKGRKGRNDWEREGMIGRGDRSEDDCKVRGEGEWKRGI